MSERALGAQPGFHGHLPYTGMGVDPAEAGVTIQPRDDLAFAIVMARKGQASAVVAIAQAAFGIALPAGPRRIAVDGLAFIGMAPGQWLAVGQGGDPAGFAGRLQRSFGAAASVCDQSDSRAVVRLAGPRVRDALAKGLAIDLYPSAFGPGDAARTPIARIDAHLWQLDEGPTYEIAIPRALAGSFADFLWASAAEYGVALMASVGASSAPPVALPTT